MQDYKACAFRDTDHDLQIVWGQNLTSFTYEIIIHGSVIHMIQ